jgi:glycosyltransferase involved in cell wall biosynthesis
VHIVLITQEAPFDPEAIATGNQERAAQLEKGLTGLGHRVSRLQLENEAAGDSTGNMFTSADELQELIDNLAPDCLLVTYWELLEYLPALSRQPVILDFVAPRPLESLFEMPDGIQREMFRLRKALPRADYFIIGTERQKHLLTAWLLEAGFDLRKRLPATVLPVSAWNPLPEQSRPVPGIPLRLVSAGVDWPWRRADQYWKAFADWQGNAAYELHRYSGQYKLHTSDAAAEESGKQEMLSFRRYSDILWQQADIGLELADQNIERYYSQSFRSIGFLEHGLPLICNRYLSIASHIEAAGAGWLVDSPAEFIDVLGQLQADPGAVSTASGNARRLATSDLHISNTITALEPYLARPEKSHTLAALPVAGVPTAAADTRLAVPGFAQRLRKQVSLVVQWICLRLNRDHHGENVVIITREDLFPTDHGAAVKIVETARGLSRNDRSVAIVSSDRKQYWLVEEGEFSQHKYPFWLRLLALPRMLVELLHRSKDIPASNSFLYLPLSDMSFAWRAIYVGKRHAAGIFQAEFPAYARAAVWARSVLGGKAVMVEHNVEYLRLQQQLAELTEAQFENLKTIEITLCNQCDAVICVSDNDRHLLIRDGVYPYLLHTIPHGVDLEVFAASNAEDVRDQFGIPESASILVYHGTFAYPPNLEAMHIFAEELLPRLAQQGHNVHVLAVGRNPPARSAAANIHYTGSVDVVAGYLKAADVAVVPLQQGGGTRMKILDYFACGVPVISTRKGIEGIPVENGVEALIEDDWDLMAVQISKLLTDPGAAENLATAAEQWVKKLDWTALAADYIRVFER